MLELNGNEGEERVVEIGDALKGLEGLRLWEAEDVSLGFWVESPEGRD